MEKVTSPDRSRTARGSRTGPAYSIAAAVVGPLCVIFLTGYLTIQLQLAEAARVVTLVVLVAAVIAGAYTSRPIPNDGEPHPLGLYSLINGATSPFTLAPIGAVIADLIVRRRTGPGIAG